MSLRSNTTLLDDFLDTDLYAQMSTYEGIAYRRWDPLANLCMANLLCYYCFYLPNVLYIESTVSFLGPQFKDFALISSILSFALGLLARPLGGLFFGLEADSKNIRTAYYKSTMLLAVATLALSFLPPYSYLGVVSSVINIALRMTQGFALGGAYTCAALLAYQLAPDRMQGQYTSFVQLSSPAGYLTSLALVIVSKLFYGEETFTNWGWRTTFLLALVLFYFSRKVLQGHSHFTIHAERSRRQVLGEIKKLFFENKAYRRAFFFYVLPTFSAICLSIYVSNIYQLYFMQTILKVEPMRAKFILAISSFIFLPGMIVAGFLADRLGARKVVLTGFITVTVAVIPIYRLIYYMGTSIKDDLSALSFSTVGLILSCTLISLIAVFPFSPIIVWAAKLFPNQYRTTLFACCHGFAFGILATIGQLMGTYFNEANVTPFAAVYFSVAVNLIALMAWTFAKPPAEKITLPFSQ